MADDHLGWFIYFYFLFMSGSNQGVCHMVIVWEGDTSQDICQYQELSPCYPHPVLTTTLPINLPTNHFQPPDFVPIYIYAPCNTFTQFSKNKSFEFRTKIMSINS